MINKIKKIGICILGLLILNSGYTCTVFIKNDGKNNYIFAKSRDVTFNRYDSTYYFLRQENVVFHVPKKGYKYISLQYSQSQPDPNIFSTGTNEKNLSMSYNYDSSQLGSTGDNLSEYTPSIINMADKFNRYLISNAATLNDVNKIIKQAVYNFNNKSTEQEPFAVPMLLSFAQHNKNKKDIYEVVEIVISNPNTVKKTYFKSLKISGYQDFQENKKCISILNNMYGKGFNKDIVNIYNKVFMSNQFICSYIGRTSFKNNYSNLASYYFADQVAKLTAYNNLKLDYKIKKSNDYLIETNSITSLDLQKYTYFVPPESISRYDSLDTLLKNSEQISKLVNDKNGYSRELAIMFLNDIYNPSKYDLDGYTMSSNMAVSRESSRAKYVVSFIKDNTTGREVPYIFVEITSPAQPYNRATIKLNKCFWEEHKNNDIIVDKDEFYYKYHKMYQNYNGQ
ncbi:hypothetical protein [Francisella salina]|uniref:Lipoprotein n=1 Tax=Francisella salina TaxID=573569 RepID=A0ABN3ZPA5_FRAST|nr:hypothetical protein [Francisella salina]AEI36899.1 hypothetical protein F7308_1975 [Francisella salina]